MSLKVRVFEVEIICKAGIVCQYEMHTRKGRCFSFLTPAFFQVIDIHAGCILNAIECPCWLTFWTANGTDI